MSYQEKYLKYRAKYLALKSNIKKDNQSQTRLDNNINLELHDGKIFDINNLTDTPNFKEDKNNLQLGGGKINNQLLNIDNLTDTPSMSNILNIITHTNQNKNQINKFQFGGRGNSTKIQNKSFRTLKNQDSFNQTFSDDSKFINNLTATPKLIDIWGGYYTNNKEVNNLVRLLSDTDDINTYSNNPQEPNPSEQPSDESSDESSKQPSDEFSEQPSDESSKQPSDESSEKPLEKPSKQPSNESSEQDSSQGGNSNSHKKFFFEESDIFSSTETSNSEHNSSQIGGKKPNSHKKFFFEESDIFSSSETSNSDLLTFDSSTINSSDSDL